MKELSIEEKAKRYDELKVTAQGLEHDGCFDKITLYDLFPELQESEDEENFIKSVEALEDFGKFELADWLKEHKTQFFKHQSTWKPSNEIIEALDFAADCILPAEYDIKRKVLKELLEQLKKLK